MASFNSDQVKIYTDGSCSPNPGKGGWGYFCQFNDLVIEHKGGDPDSTNSRMEIIAVLAGLQMVIENSDLFDNHTIIIVTDSAYVCNTLKKNGWLNSWKSKGWKLASGKPVKNLDLWKEIDDQLAELKSLGIEVNTEKVTGHSGDPGNERADALANQGRLEL